MERIEVIRLFDCKELAVLVRFADLVADISMLYLEVVTDLDDTDVLNALLMIVECENPVIPGDPSSMHKAFCRSLNDWKELSNTPARVISFGSKLSRVGSVTVVRAPAVPQIGKLQIVKTGYSVPYVKRYRMPRTKDSTLRGLRLMKAALAMRGWFNWVPRWGSEVAPLRNFRDEGGDQPGTQCFSMWVNGYGREPDPLTSMNCWESVLYSAFSAGLLTRGQLRASYGAAMWAARIMLDRHLPSIHRVASVEELRKLEYDKNISSAFKNFVDILDRQLLGSAQALPVILSTGMIPRAGDLVFVNGGPRGHVAISLGRTWAGGVACDRIISLWIHNGRHFDVIDLATLQGQGALTYRPCPF